MPDLAALETHKLAVKIPVQAGQDIPLDEFVPVFHAWIQQQDVADHLLIDVANYKHVVDGPGVVLVTHQANIHIDDTDGQRGLLYIRKQPLAGGFPKRVGQIIGYALGLAHRLENEQVFAGRLKFDPSRLIFRINDRLHVRNTAEAFEQLQPILKDALGGALASREIKLTQTQPDPERLFEVVAQR